jgi:hypothetical protein
MGLLSILPNVPLSPFLSDSTDKCLSARIDVDMLDNYLLLTASPKLG